VTDSNGGNWRIAGPVYSGSSQVYAGAVLSGGPADYWRFAETSTADAVNQVHGGLARYNAVTLGTPSGPFADSTVAGFNGTSGYVALPATDVPTTGPVSISLWFKMPSGNTSGGVLYSYQTADANLNPTVGGWVPALYIGADGKLRGQFWINDTSRIITTTGTVNDGAWHHVALAASTNTQSLYLDGARIGSALSAALVNPGMTAAYVGAGKWANWPGQATGKNIGYFPGAIGEFAYYRGQLSDAQVAAQFAARGKTSGAPVKTYTITDPGNRTETRVYDLASDRQVAQTDSGGNRTQYGYDTSGFLRTTTDPNGNLTVTEHDVRGNVVSTSSCQDQAANKCSTVYYTYFPDDTSKNPTPDPRNDLMLTTRDGRSTAATDNSYLTSYTYDPTGNRTAVRDPLGRSTLTTYTDGTSTAAFDGGLAPPGLPATLTTPGGARQTVVYYRSGEVATITDPAGKLTRYSYDALGRVTGSTEITDRFPAGLAESYRYDGLNRALSHTSAPVTDRVTGAVHTAVDSTVYDVDGLATTQQVADSTGGDTTRTISASYDAHGQALHTTDAAGNTTNFGYDAYGNVVDEVGADGGEIRSTFDGEGHLLTSALIGYTGDPNKPAPPTNQLITTRVYDPAGRLSAVTDAMSWVTAYTYTDNNLAASVTRRDPSTGASFVQQATGYDAAGNVTSQTTNNGTTKTLLTLDAAGRTTSSTLDPAGLRRTTTYALSPDDYVQTATVTDGSGTMVGQTSTGYDPLGRVTSQSVRKDAAGAALTTTYTLDQAGLPKSSTDPNGNTTTIDVDQAGRAVVSTGPAAPTETNGGAPVTIRPITSIGYDTFGEQVESQDPLGNVSVVGYDADGRVTSNTGPAYTPPGTSTPVVPVATRGYDALGQLTASVDPLGRRTTYGYDQLGHQAKQTAPNGGVATFTTDLLGDRTSVTDPTDAVSTATYDFLGRELTSTDVVRQDANHYITSNAYTDPGGALSSTTSPTGVITRMAYDAAGELLTVTDGAGNVTTNSYDGAGRKTKVLLPDGSYTSTRSSPPSVTTRPATAPGSPTGAATPT
jgi:YD repeat-containing protein